MYVSAFEYIQTLKHSYIPTVITEGDDDYSVFRRIEEKFSSIGLSLMPVGSKQSVLEIFRHRHEFSQIQTAFIVDRDIWIFSGIPAEYQDPAIIVTDGYSIENDLYRDGEMESLLLVEERSKFYRDLYELVQWFSYAVKRFLDGHDIQFDVHPDRIVDASGKLLPNLSAQFGYNGPCPLLLPSIAENYPARLRGKTLMSLLVRYLSAKRRAIKHSRKSLLEAASVRNGPYMTSIHNRIDTIFAV
jgi:hypothetical protein